MTTEEILQVLEEQFPDCWTPDGFDAALIGVVEGACRETVACYDYRKCVQILMERDGMDEDGAEEFLNFNVTGAFMGDHTPVFLHDWRREGAEGVEECP